jgi:hypothetical protein
VRWQVDFDVMSGILRAYFLYYLRDDKGEPDWFGIEGKLPSLSSRELKQVSNKVG